MGDWHLDLWVTNQITTKLTGHISYIYCLFVLNDGTLISGSCAKNIQLWNTVADQCTTTLTGHKNTVYCLVVLNDGTLWSGSIDNNIIKLWKAAINQLTTTLIGHKCSVCSLVVLNNSAHWLLDFIIILLNDGILLPWNSKRH